MFRDHLPSLVSRAQEFWYAIIVHLNTLTHPSRELLQIEFYFNCTVICNENSVSITIPASVILTNLYTYTIDHTGTTPFGVSLQHFHKKEKDNPKTVSYSRSLSPTDQQYSLIKREFSSII